MYVAAPFWDKGIIKIDNIHIDPVILAPLSGVTDLPFREVVRQCGAGLLVSEMIASRAMVMQARKTMMKCTAPDSLTSVQLAGCEPDVMAEAAKLNEDLGVRLIDINFGCPVKKVVGGNAGSALMRDEVLAGQILQSMVKAVRVPVSLKMRLGWDDSHRNAPKLAKIAEDCGIKMITVHGRTRAQMFNGQADWKAVAQVKQAVRIPVVVNGDIKSTEDVKQALSDSGADGVMIGRAAYGNPWIINQAIQFMRGELAVGPTHEQKRDVVLHHYRAIIEHYGHDAGAFIARKHVGWYTRGMPGSAAFRAAFNMAGDFVSGVRMVEEFFA